MAEPVDQMRSLLEGLARAAPVSVATRVLACSRAVTIEVLPPGRRPTQIDRRSCCIAVDAVVAERRQPPRAQDAPFGRERGLEQVANTSSSTAARAVIGLAGSAFWVICQVRVFGLSGDRASCVSSPSQCRLTFSTSGLRAASSLLECEEIGDECVLQHRRSTCERGWRELPLIDAPRKIQK